MTVAALGDVADFINGFAFKPGDWHEEGLPIIRIQNLTDPTKPINLTTRSVPEKFRVRRGDLLVSWSATLGVFTWDRSDEAWVNQHIFRVVPSDRVDQAFLRHMLSGALEDMQRHLHGATMQHVNRAEFLATKIPLPTLAEQRRIAAILDHADALRVKRRQILTHFDALAQSIFSDVVGATPWASSLGDLAQVQIGPFGSLLHQEDYVSDGVAVINPMHIRGGVLNPDPEFSVSEEKASTLSLYRLRSGDIVLGRRGEMGRAGIASTEHAGMLCGTGSIILRPREVDSRFLHAVVTSARMRGHLERSALGATMPNLNAGIVKAAPAPRLPLEVQATFTERLAKVERCQGNLVLASSTDAKLFTSLQARAFRGEL